MEELLEYSGTKLVSPILQVSNEYFKAANASCSDTINTIMSWSDAKSKCGFNDTNGDKIYYQTVTVTRYYLDELRPGETFSRAESSTHNLQIV